MAKKNVMDKQVSRRDFLKGFGGILAVLSFGGLFAFSKVKTITETKTNTKTVKEYLP